MFMTLRHLSARSARKSIQRGLSVVELMIGVAIGLFIVAGGAKMLADGLVGNRRVIIESRITQDLRAAADVIARDLRRAGFWNGSLAGMAESAAANGYRTVSPEPSQGVVNRVTYNYERLAGSTEQYGFDLGAEGSVGVLLMRAGAGGWQPLTDSRSVNVTNFTVQAITGEISLGEMCRGSPLTGSAPSSACCSPASNATQCKHPIVERTASGYTPTGGFTPPTGTLVRPTCPELVVRRFEIVITGQGLGANSDVIRTIRETVRVRNDAVTYTACPT